MRVVDVYPSVDRSLDSHGPSVTSDKSDAFATTKYPSILPSSKLWLVRQNRLAAGAEHLQFQGMPLSSLSPSSLAGITDASMSDLAGNAFNAGSYATVLLAVFASVQHLACFDVADTNDVADDIVDFAADVLR